MRGVRSRNELLKPMGQLHVVTFKHDAPASDFVRNHSLARRAGVGMCLGQETRHNGFGIVDPESRIECVVTGQPHLSAMRTSHSISVVMTPTAIGCRTPGQTTEPDSSYGFLELVLHLGASQLIANLAQKLASREANGLGPCNRITKQDHRQVEQMARQWPIKLVDKRVRHAQILRFGTRSRDDIEPSDRV